jgi:hypothetical protein
MKKVTHVLAAISAAIVAFSVTPAGQAVIHQYPVLSGIAGALGAISAWYHNPIK